MALLPFLPSKCWDIFHLVHSPQTRTTAGNQGSIQPEEVSQPININEKILINGGYSQNGYSNTAANEATLSSNKDTFYVMLDVQQFKPEEISVKVAKDNILIVEGKHEERQDHHGFISRQFIRKYKVPMKYDMQKISTELSADGVLRITILPSTEKNEPKHKIISIIQTGKPAKHQTSKVQQQTIQVQQQLPHGKQQIDQNKPETIQDKEEAVKNKQPIVQGKQQIIKDTVQDKQQTVQDKKEIVEKEK